MELSCDVRDPQPSQRMQLIPRAPVLFPRRAAVAAAELIRTIAEEEKDIWADPEISGIMNYQNCYILNWSVTV